MIAGRRTGDPAPGRGTGPSARGPAASDGGRTSPPCGQMGRFVQTWTSLTVPKAPARIMAAALRSAAVGRALVAHLRGHLHLAGDLAQAAGFVDRVRQRLLREAVLAQLHGHGAGRGVRVVGRADGDGVDALAHLVEHLAEVVDTSWPRANFWPALSSVLSSMSQMATMLPRLPASAESLWPLPPTPMQAKLILFVGQAAEGRLRAAGDPEAGAGQGRRPEKIATVALVTHGFRPLATNWCFRVPE